MYILNTGQIAQLMRLGANEVEGAGSLSKRVLFWVQSSVDPVKGSEHFDPRDPRVS